MTTALVATALVAPSPAAADPIPGLGQAWPMCGQAPDTDGRYCVLSVTRDGLPPEAPPGGDGDWEEPYIDLIGDGDVRFGINHWYRTGSDLSIVGDVDPSAEWVWVVNTGPIRTHEVYGHMRDVDLSFGGSASTGWTFTLSLRPTPTAWWWDDTGPLPCSYDGGCGDDSTVATLVYSGFVTGYVTDGVSWGLPPDQVADRVGYINAYNAQDASAYYDPSTNAMVVRMANPHLSAPGEPAVGYYETFLPDGMLVNQFDVPDPDSLTGGSFTVRRSGSTTEVPFVLTHEPGGIRIKLSAITFSTPQFKIKPNPSRPGIPRRVRVNHVSAHAVKVAFRAPAADGGARITGYQAQCRRGDHPWRKASGPASPLVVRDLPKSTVSCRVRAVNRIGRSLWSGLHMG